MAVDRKKKKEKHTDQFKWNYNFAAVFTLTVSLQVDTLPKLIFIFGITIFFYMDYLTVNAFMQWHQWPILLTWINFNPGMDK